MAVHGTVRGRDRGRARRRSGRAVGAVLAGVLVGALTAGCGAVPLGVAAAPAVGRGALDVAQGLLAAAGAPAAAPARTGDVQVVELGLVEAGTTDTPADVADGPAAPVAPGAPAVDGRADGDLVVDAALPAGRTASDVVDAAGFQTLGVTWPQGSAAGPELLPQVRTRTDGVWTGWEDLTTSDAAPHTGTADESSARAADAERDGTDSLWVDDVDAVQLSVVASAAAQVDDVRLALVGTGDPADADAAAAGAPAVGVAALPAAVPAVAVPAATVLPAAAGAPTIVPRSAWGATAPSCAMDTARSVVGVVVHHTAGPNTYTTQAAAMQQLRNDQRYHMQSRGWCDLGYNFVVDRWGTVYEGRAGSITAPVIGVHAGGFNTGTVGVAMLGTYDAAPPAATQAAVARIAAWKLRAAGLDPDSTMQYWTGAGENSRFTNQTVTLPRIFGHRDVAYTACPGDGGYGALPAIRRMARGDARPLFVTPSVSASSVARGTPVVVRAATIGDIRWRLDVVDERTGIRLRSDIGYAQQALGGVVATWSGTTDAGLTVGAGPYRLLLTGTDAATGEDVPAWSTVVQVTGTTTPAVVAPVALTGDLTFVPVTPARLLDTRPTGQSLGPRSRVDVTVAGVAGVPAGARAVALNVTAVSASTATYVRGWPAGATEPASSLLNAAPGATSAATTVLGVGGEGKVSLSNAAGSVHLLVDVTGYWVAGGGARFGRLATPARLLDSRLDGGIAPGQSRRVAVAGVAGVPADATAVMLNVTSARASGAGYVSVVAAGADATATSSVNHRPGEDVANRATVGLVGGAVDVHVEGGATGVVVDVVGWYGPSGTLRLTPVQPTRVLDTRGGAPLGGGATLTFPVRDAVPGAASAVGAVGTLTATQQTAPSTYLTAWTAGAPRPGTSDLNTGAGRDQANLALLAWDGSGRVSTYNDRGSTHLVVDVTALLG